MNENQKQYLKELGFSGVSNYHEKEFDNNITLHVDYIEWRKLWKSYISIEADCELEIISIDQLETYKRALEKGNNIRLELLKMEANDEK